MTTCSRACDRTDYDYPLASTHLRPIMTLKLDVSSRYPTFGVSIAMLVLSITTCLRVLLSNLHLESHIHTCIAYISLVHLPLPSPSFISSRSFLLQKLVCSRYQCLCIARARLRIALKRQPVKNQILYERDFLMIQH